VQIRSKDIRVFYTLAVVAVLIGGLGQFPLIEAQISPVCDDMYGSGGNQGQDPGSIFLVSQVDGSQTFIGDPTASGGVSGLAFDSSGNLVGSVVFGPPPTSDLIEIDPVTGSLSNNIGVIFDATGVEVKIADLATQPGTGNLFGIGAGANDGDLFSISKLNGFAALIGNPGSGVGAIGFAPDGTLFFVPRSAQTLETLNPSNGNVLTSVVRSEGIELDALGVRSDGTIFVAGTPFLIGGDGRDIWTIAIDGTMSLIGNGVRQVADLDFVPCPIGGTMIPIDSTSLLLAGAQMNAAWMIPVIVSAIGIGIVIARKL